MRFQRQAIEGVVLVEVSPHIDERGLFARTFCEDTFAAEGLVSRYRQCSVSVSVSPGTLRGLHFQTPPNDETKLVRCSSGAVFDVIVDLRPSSPTYLDWLSFELTAQARNALYVPSGVAHGFQTLTEGAEVLYMIDKPYAQAAASGIRWDDPVLNVAWPLPVAVISERDRSLPDWVA